MTTRFIVSAFLLCCLWSGGCGSKQPADAGATVDQADVAITAPADPHDTPLTDEEINQLRNETVRWSAALERIQEFAATIKLETTSKVPKDHWQAIGENTQALRDAFNVLHANIDAGKDPGHDAVAAEIQVAVEALAAIQPATVEDAPPTE